MRKVAQSRLSKQKSLRKQYAGKTVRPGKAKIKGISQIMCERTLFLAKTWSQILKLSIGKWKIVLALFQKVRFRSDTTYNYVKEIFTDILDVERNALKGRILFLGRDTYFDELISSLRTFLLAEYKNFLDQEFLSTSSAYEAGRYQNPLNDLSIQKKIEEYSDRIHRLTVDTINSMREEFKQERNKGVLKAVSKIFGIIKYIILR